MANETLLTIIGNMVQDPELRFTPSGAAVANFSVASTPKTFDRNANEWKDGESLFMRCAAWKELGENVAETLTKGMRVVVTGRLKSRSYETKEGEKRTVIELEVDEIGPSLRWATAKVTRANRQAGASGGFAGNSGQQGGGSWGGGQQAAQQPAGGDPWATPGATSNAGGWGNGPDSEPPF
jgi:single-strand DNA-binding protein